uniref:Uncharacterized protein n=1 Tax=Anguilla anguilla TaxID=7936 RepID=A0A0E9W033_ANGAN
MPISLRRVARERQNYGNNGLKTSRRSRGHRVKRALEEAEFRDFPE